MSSVMQQISLALGVAVAATQILQAHANPQQTHGFSTPIEGLSQ